MPIHFGNKIKELIDNQRTMSNRDIAEKLGMTEVNFYKVIKKEDMSTELLKRVAEVLDTPLSWFFGDTATQVATGNGNKQLINSQLYEQEHAALETCRKEVEYLKAQVRDKEMIINLLTKK